MIKITKDGLKYSGAPLNLDSVKSFDATTEAMYVATGKAEYVNEQIELVTKPPLQQNPTPALVETNPLTGGIKESPRAGDVAIFAPSSKYKFFIPGFQHVGSGAAKDKSGQGTDAVIAAAYTDAKTWANKGYITIEAGTEQYLTIPAAKMTVDLNVQSRLLMFRFNKAAPAGNEPAMGNTDGATLRGFGLGVKATTGKLYVKTATNGATFTSTADTTAAIADGTDHCVAILWDALANTVSVWVDGTLSDTFTSAWIVAPYVASSRDAAIGGNFQNSGQTSYACKMSGIHLMAWDGGAPSNIGLLAQKHAASPNMYFTDADFVF